MFKGPTSLQNSLKFSHQHCPRRHFIIIPVYFHLLVSSELSYPILVCVSFFNRRIGFILILQFIKFLFDKVSGL